MATEYKVQGQTLESRSINTLIKELSLSKFNVDSEQIHNVTRTLYGK